MRADADEGSMNLVFFGSGAFGVPTLRALAERHRVRAVVTQPDRPAGRGRKLTPNPIAAFAAAELPGARVFKPERASADDVRDTIRGVEAEAWVVIAFGQKLSPALLADRFAINLHASLLPRWRGAAPIHHAVLAGDAVTGNSVITLADRMDAGRVLGRSERRIEAGQTTGELHDLLAADGPELVLRVLDEFRAGVLRPEVQDESKVTLAGKLSREDAALPAGASATDLARRINGLSPWPGVTARVGGVDVKLLRAASSDVTRSQEGPGPTLIDERDGVFACVGGGLLRVMEIQPVGRQGMDWASFARGHGVGPGAVLEAMGS